ncbi:MAG: hypothetical protein KGO50_11650, partial [Myxococcales bacterium]|nr:hypothetical protein [Myxococcales bacterium]
MLVAIVKKLSDDVRRTSVPVYAFALSEALCVMSPRLFWRTYDNIRTALCRRRGMVAACFAFAVSFGVSLVS